MPGLPAAPGVVALDHRFTLGADQNVNSTLHFRYTGAAPDTTGLAALATAVQNQWVTSMQGHTPRAVTLNEIIARDLSDPVKPVGINSTASAGVGSASGMGPASAALVIGYKIARRYRGGHPRGYWPLMTAGDLATPGSWSAASIADKQTAFEAYITGLSGITSGAALGAQCSVSFYNGGAYVTVAGRKKPKYVATLRDVPVVDNITVRTYATRVGSQRRRLKKA